ncbi:MAG: ABC transporter ATP-binding protein [Pirellulales bacterium]|nr:ABC transporter ATP-binding protein [Pirellulales bacterium]
MIEIDQVTRRYGAKVAVEQLSLAIPAGELFAFLGPNGAGKTTTIKMLVGLLRPTTGQIRLSGHDLLSSPRDAHREMSYVPDVPYLYDKLTGREFLQFIADMYGLAPRLASERIAEEIERFELSDFVDNLAESYSHGMKQRLVFASALIHDPRILVIDEPMVGLDPRSARLLKDLLRQKASGGTTIFMSTHTLDVVEEIADRIGVIHRGRLQFLGTIGELKQRLQRHDSSLERLFLELTDSGDLLEAADRHHQSLHEPQPPRARAS